LTMLSKTRFLISIPLVLAVATVACAAEQPEEAAPQAGDLKLTTSYAIGWQAGRSFTDQGLELDQASLIQGLQDAMGGAASKWTEEEMTAAMQQMQSEMMAKQQARAQEQATVNQAAGEEFLATNGQREGVVTTASGLQYEVERDGDGPSPGPTDTVTVHYRGTLIDGTEFDSSYARDQPATFPLDRVIPGWTEGLQLMSVGSKWKLYVPASLGYGERGAGPKIGPSSTLIFEVELLDVAQ